VSGIDSEASLFGLLEDSSAIACPRQRARPVKRLVELAQVVGIGEQVVDSESGPGSRSLVVDIGTANPSLFVDASAANPTF